MWRRIAVELLRQGDVWHKVVPGVDASVRLE